MSSMFMLIEASFQSTYSKSQPVGQSARGFPSLGDAFFLEPDLEVRDKPTEDLVHGGDVAAVEKFGDGGRLELGVGGLTKSGSTRVREGEKMDVLGIRHGGRLHCKTSMEQYEVIIMEKVDGTYVS
jgi:hypothetical protein